ncbi:MAG: hypothetical protein HYV09_38165 [Deltaproteobacteria bacterium]|nr:hypothetical protein [Deltaproteobacteria bacterium]
MSLVESLRRIVMHVASFGLPPNGERWLFVAQLCRHGVAPFDAERLVDAAIAEGLEQRAPRSIEPPPP